MNPATTLLFQHHPSDLEWEHEVAHTWVHYRPPGPGLKSRQI
jgi:hypothetical protein